MRLEASVTVRRSPAQVWAYLGDMYNVPAWDRGVAAIQAKNDLAQGVGFEFETLARSRRTLSDPDWGKMAYRIVESDPERGCAVQLTSTTGNARYFKTALWRFWVKPDRCGATAFCTAEFTLRRRYFFLAPVLLLMKSAIGKDLEALRREVEKGTS